MSEVEKGVEDDMFYSNSYILSRGLLWSRALTATTTEREAQRSPLTRSLAQRKIKKIMGAASSAFPSQTGTSPDAAVEKLAALIRQNSEVTVSVHPVTTRADDDPTVIISREYYIRINGGRAYRCNISRGGGGDYHAWLDFTAPPPYIWQ